MRSRSLFWPLVLVATGLTWLLISLGVVPSANLWALYHFIPYFILTLGISLILRSRWERIGRIVSSLAIGLAVLAVVFAAPLGWNKSPQWGWAWEGSDQFLTLDFDESVPGSGVIVSETRELAEFHAIEINFPCELDINQGEIQSVTIKADDNLLPQLETSVSNGVLTIERERGGVAEHVRPTRKVLVTLTVTDLDRLDIPSAGSVDIENLHTDSLTILLSGAAEVNLSGLDLERLEIELSGAGSIKADGTVEDLTIEVSGVGSFEGDDLAAQNAEASISGTGSATVWVVKSLDAEISGIGSLNYYGSPMINRSVSGLGGINHIGDK